MLPQKTGYAKCDFTEIFSILISPPTGNMKQKGLWFYLEAELEDLQALHVELLVGSAVVAETAGNTAGWAEGLPFALTLPGEYEPAR